MWTCPEDHPGGEASLSSHFSFLHTQRGTKSARLTLPRRGDVFTPWQRWCHFHAPYKGLSRFKCNTLVEHNVHLKESTYNNFLVCSLTCLSGWMKLIPCFRREPVCWSWFMELSASAAKTLSPNFRCLFIFLPNTGHGFYATIFLTTTVTVYGCSWRVRVYLSAYVHIKPWSLFFCWIFKHKHREHGQLVKQCLIPSERTI